MSAVPVIDAHAAVAAGLWAMPPGPRLDPAEAGSVADGLRAAALASVQPVADVTHLDADAAGPMKVVDRANWLRANVDMVVAMLAEASGEPSGTPRLRDRAAGHANGVQVGALLAVLGTRILGQWLPFGAEPQLLLVAPNIAKVEAELGVRPRDFRLWVCLHEQTHRLQFTHAPWLRAHLMGEMGLLLADGQPGASGPRAANLVESMLSPDQRVVLGRVSAAMSLLEGHADDMMDRVGPSVVPTVRTIRKAFDGRRRRGGWTKVLNKALGMDLKLAQYRDGAAFCRAVIAHVGVDGLNAVFASAEHLPTPDEIRDSRMWVERVHG